MTDSRDKHEFIEMSYEGSRFEGGNLPLEVLGDLVVYREIILEISKDLWKRAHPTRQRLPRGFEDFLRLSFKEVTNGSAACHVERQPVDLTPLFGDDPVADIFDEAQNVFLRGINAANSGGWVDEIPMAIAPKIGSFGKRLGEKEQISFRPTGRKDAEKVSYSRRTREIFFQRAGLPYERVIDGFGILKGTNESKSTIKVRSELGEFDLQVGKASVRDSFDGKIGSVIEFTIEAQFSNEAKISRVISTLSADLVEDGPDIVRLEERFDEFRRLEDGWLNGIGNRINADVLVEALDLARFINSTFEGLRSYPTEDGGVRLEFNAEDVDISIEFEPKGKVHLHALDLSTDLENDRTFKGINDSLLASIMNIREGMK